MPIITKFNHFPEVRTKMVVGGKATTEQTLKAIADAIKSGGPYKNVLTTDVKTEGGIGRVDVNPWWIGFIEVGTATHAARPFAGPAATRVLATFVPKMRAVGEHL